MKKSETAALLSMCAAFDQRTIGEADVEAWHAVIDDLPAEDAMTVVRDHYRDSRDRIMPADVRRAVRRIRRQRLDAAPPAAPPADLDPDDELSYRRWLAAHTRAVAAGEATQTTPGVETYVDEAHRLARRDMRAIEGTFRGVSDV